MLFNTAANFVAKVGNQASFNAILGVLEPVDHGFERIAITKAVTKMALSHSYMAGFGVHCEYYSCNQC